MRYPLKPRDFADLPDDELVEHREFLNGKDGRGYIPFSPSTMKSRLRAGTFPKPSIRAEGGRASLWRVKDIKTFKRRYDVERLESGVSV